MIAEIEAGNVATVIVKDMSHLGRDYLKVGYYTEIFFVERDVRYIAINDGVDSAKGDNDFTPFRNLFNDFYAKDTSKKVRAIKRAQGMAGEHLTKPPYGYKVDSNDRKKWRQKKEMKFIKNLKDGDRVFDIYLCKHRQAAVTKNGKPYETVVLQDKTGTIDAKVWEPNSPGIGDYDALDYIEVYGDVTSFQGALQVSVKRIRVCAEGECDPSNYLPVSSRNIDEMYNEMIGLIKSIENTYLRQLLESFFIKDEKFIKVFRNSSAAKSVHHGFVGGLLEHTLSVAKLCDYYCTAYPILKRDLLLTAAMCHDIGKTRELSAFPENDYTDEGQLLGHIVMGSQMIGEHAAAIADFPRGLLNQLQHCILAHHGKYEYGSPKIPAIIEAVALNYADDTDAKMETFKEILDNNSENTGWLGYNRLFESNLIATKL